MAESNKEVYVKAEELLSLVSTKLANAGLNRKHAELTADVLVNADLRGVHSHGVIRTEHYVRRLKAGSLNGNPDFKFKTLRSGCGLFDADDGMGHVATNEAMTYAINMAKESGIAMVGVENSSHCGALSYFVTQAIENRMIGIAIVQTDKCVNPFGGAQPFFGTNPIAFGFPCEKNPPVILDMATSNVAYGKVLHAREKNVSIPETWGLDQDGAPTTDPHLVRGLTPLGGYKGYGIGMVVDVLTGILLGAQFGPHIAAMYDGYEQKRKLASTVIAIDPATYISADHFMSQMDAMVDQLHAQPTGPGFEKVLVPGDIELALEERYRKDGVPVVGSIYQYLKGDQ
ncbi:ureidoglycolate dehydrogenase [Pelobacter seleniigenes]|uniref:ureidoglycolate dehydrogenase n=1 Tax=Pelobacter seleniigenes TaxID=407188 RepID=UPI0004A75626|nr:ureidoglycolate dehydrogenase [Pelobacter seleniigenes]